MTEKERNLRQQMEEKTKEFHALLEENKIDEATEVRNQLVKMKQSLDMMQEVDAIIPPPTVRATAPEEKATTDGFSLMARALRGNLPMEQRAAMNEGTEADGGYIVPKDVQTAINELKRAFNPLEGFVAVENVSTQSGTRVYEALGEMTPFANVTELGAITELTGPKFRQIAYNIKKYAGILPISNELLADTDQNLLAYVNNWLAKKDVITRNSEIIRVMKTFTAKPLSTLDDIKGVLNLDLDPMIALSSVIITNQNGFNHLDKLKDSDGRYLLQPNPLDPTQKMLFAKPVYVIGNTFLPNDTQKAPVVVGSLKDAITLFDRQALSLLGTNVGGSAFVNDRYDIRAITRFDVQKVDDQAAVYGTLTLA